MLRMSVGELKTPMFNRGLFLIAWNLTLGGVKNEKIFFYCFNSGFFIPFFC